MPRAPDGPVTRLALRRLRATLPPNLQTAFDVMVEMGYQPRDVARQLLSGSDEDETAWRDGQWYTARLLRGPLRPGDRRTTEADCASDRIRLEVRTPGDVESLEFTVVDRVTPGPGEIEVAVTASSINFADVLVAFGRYPTFEGYKQQLGIDFAGIVTAVFAALGREAGPASLRA